MVHSGTNLNHAQGATAAAVSERSFCSLQSATAFTKLYLNMLPRSQSIFFFSFFFFFFKRFYLFLDRGEGREKEGGRETSICGCLSHAPYWRPGLETQACALTGSPPDDPWARRQALNPLSHTNQGSPSSSELSFFSAFCTFILLRIYKIPIIS